MRPTSTDTHGETAPFDPASLDDHARAAERLAELRAKCPVSALRPGLRTVVREEDVRRILADAEGFSAEGNFNLDADDQGFPVLPITQQDPPEHTALRKRYMRWFSPARLRERQDRVREIVDAIVSPIDFSEPVDVFRAIARPVPRDVIYDMIGIPTKDWERVGKWGNAVLDTVPAPIDEIPEFHLLMAYLVELIAERGNGPATNLDLIDGLTHPTAEGDALSSDETLVAVISIFLAGADTTAAAITNLLWHLLSERSRWVSVCEERNLGQRAIEESLRLDAPIQYVMRKPRNDIEIAGCPVQAGEKLVLSIQSSNWDPDAWGDEAHLFSFDRAGRSHLAFGHGIHTCFGAALARLEMTAVLDALIERSPSLRIAHDWQYHLAPTVLMRRPIDLIVVA